MIEVIKQKNTKDGANHAIMKYSDTQFKGPFLGFIKSEYPKRVNIIFDRAYAEDSQYADKTYMQLVIDALSEIERSIPEESSICVEAWGKTIEIPRNTDKFEIQEIIFDFIIRNASFYERNGSKAKVINSKIEQEDFQL